jgi:dsRNA-specific ribonuclease
MYSNKSKYMSQTYKQKNHQNTHAHFTPNNINQYEWFKDGDFKNHILNEKNIPITENFLNKIFKKYNFDHKVQKLNNFQIAMTHVSYLNKTIVKDKTAKLLKDVEPISSDKRKSAMSLQPRDYNTFEYYGDSVIHLVLTQYLYTRYPTKDSGFLTKLRTKLEKAETLSFLSKKIGLDRYVVIGRNMEQNNARENDVHLTEDIFEAFVWALLLETTYGECKQFIVNLIEREIDFAELISLDDNYKEKIMQYFHKMKWKDPKYIEKKESRKTTANCHDQEFVICLIGQDDDRVIGIGTGNTKSKAEQNAAYSALIKLKAIVDSNNNNNNNNNNSDSNIDSDSDYYEESDYFDEFKSESSENKKDNLVSDQIMSEWLFWFKDGDYKNHMLNENNIKITDKFINNILKKYGLSYKIKNLDVFQTAMTHISYLDKITLKEKTAILLKDIPPISEENKKKVLNLQKDDYGRLSHLGNALTRLALTEYLCQRYSSKDQGFLTKLRIKIERAETLSSLTSQLGLCKYAIIARNMEINGARNDDISLMKGIFEAFLGALSLENSYEECKKLLINLFERDLDFAELLNQDDNYKEKLMQYFHKMKWKEPQYVEKEENSKSSESKEENSDLFGEEEKNHNTNQEREFVMFIKNNEGQILGVGIGNTKNKAEQNAAHDALVKFKVVDSTDDDMSDYYGEMSDNENISENSDYFYAEE